MPAPTSIHEYCASRLRIGRTNSARLPRAAKARRSSVAPTKDSSSQTVSGPSCRRDGGCEKVGEGTQCRGDRGMWHGQDVNIAGALHVHSDGRPFTAIAMAPGHITLKWCKEALETVPRLRVFLIDGLRDRIRTTALHAASTRSNSAVDRLFVKDCTLLSPIFACARITRVRVRAGSRRSARGRRFRVGRDKGKLSHFWRHAYRRRDPDDTSGA